MGQINAERLQLRVRRLLTSNINDDRQTVDSTAWFRRGDLVNLILVDDAGCNVSSVVEDVIVSGVCPNDAIFFDQVLDTSSPPAGTNFYIEHETIDDVQEGFDNLCSNFSQIQDFPADICANITAQELNTPTVGQTRYTIDSDILCFLAGDSVIIFCDEGIAGLATVDDRDISNLKLTIDADIDLTAFTNCKICLLDVSIAQIFSRLKDLVTLTPIDNECPEDEDCDNTAFEMDNIFISNSSHVFLDGVRKKKGTCGTRASLVNDAGTAELTFTSMVLGTRGNVLDIVLLDPGGPSVPLSMALTGNYADGDKVLTVTLETDGGSSIISTAEEVADLINADTDGKRLVQVQFGGDGTGVQSALSATPLAGGLDDGTGDYCEIEQIENNLITGTGYKWISFWILPDLPNRMNVAPRDDEEVCFDYRKAS